MDEYQTALRLDTDCADALYGLGCVAYEQHLWAEAREHLQKAVSLNQNDNAYHRMLGMVYDQFKDDENALFHFGRASELGKNRSDEHVERRLKELRAR